MTQHLTGMVARLHLVRFIRCGLAVIIPDSARLLGIMILAAFGGLLEVGVLSIMGALVVRLTGSSLPRLPFQIDRLQAREMLALSALAIAIIAILSFVLARQQARLSTRALTRTRMNVVNAYHGASAAYRDTHREGYFQQLVGEYSNRAENLVQQLLLACVQMVTLLIFLATAIALAPHTALALVAALAACALLAAPLLSRLRRSRRDNTHNYRELIAEIGQTGRLSEEITAFDVQTLVVKALEVPVRASAAQLERLRYESRLFPSLVLCASLGIILLLIALRVMLDVRSFSGLVPLTMLLFRATGYLKGFASSVQTGIEPVETTEILLEEMVQMRHCAQNTRGRDIARFPGLRMEGVGYAYPGGQRVLHDISLDLMPGEMLGIIGASGNGKSTLASLIMRIRIPDSGRILAGEDVLADIAPAAWARLSAFVGQDSRLIHASIADNIRFYRPGFVLSQVKAAARAAHIDADIAAMPQGYDTPVGAGARGLSGGQRQRLAIARALLASPQLLVLDEPTSALDEASERLIAQTLLELKGKTSILLIAHRPVTLAICDRVLRLENGRLGVAGAPLRAVP